jgi:hypothetical protein
VRWLGWLHWQDSVSPGKCTWGVMSKDGLRELSPQQFDDGDFLTSYAHYEQASGW